MVCVSFAAVPVVSSLPEAVAVAFVVDSCVNAVPAICKAVETPVVVAQTTEVAVVSGVVFSSTVEAAAGTAVVAVVVSDVVAASVACVVTAAFICRLESEVAESS